MFYHDDYRYNGDRQMLRMNMVCHEQLMLFFWSSILRKQKQPGFMVYFERSNHRNLTWVLKYYLVQSS